MWAWSAVAAKRRKVTSLACLIASGSLVLPMKKMVKSTLADNYSDLGVDDGRN